MAGEPEWFEDVDMDLDIRDGFAYGLLAPSDTYLEFRFENGFHDGRPSLLSLSASKKSLTHTAEYLPGVRRVSLLESAAGSPEHRRAISSPYLLLENREYFNESYGLPRGLRRAAQHIFQCLERPRQRR